MTYRYKTQTIAPKISIQVSILMFSLPRNSFLKWFWSYLYPHSLYSPRYPFGAAKPSTISVFHTHNDIRHELLHLKSHSSVYTNVSWPRNFWCDFGHIFTKYSMVYIILCDLFMIPKPKKQVCFRNQWLWQAT